ncbi:MAG: hypothetical protein JWO74_5114, partial [Solirubrobacterales bacterium]|nr:hypothetical protein [Solirubrobacterales bacterium]
MPSVLSSKGLRAALTGTIVVASGALLSACAATQDS